MLINSTRALAEYGFKRPPVAIVGMSDVDLRDLKPFSLLELL